MSFSTTMQTTDTRTDYIIYVDDDEDDRFLFKEGFQQLQNSLELKLFEGGRGLLSYMDTLNSEQLPCAIICDMKMPVIDGLELLCLLKGEKRWAGVPVVIFSTSSLSRDRESAIRLGAKAYFSKPVNFNEMRQIIAGIIACCNVSLFL